MMPPSPEKCVLVNLGTGERITCQFNPEVLKERLGAVQYARKEPIGASYQIMHYRNTNNRVLPLDFYLDAIGTGYDVDHFKAFLRNASRAHRLDPPSLLFVWPRLITVVARLIEYSFTDEQFAANGAALVCTAQCTLEVDEAATRAQRGTAA